jgi:hypothetical protein
LFTSLGGDSKAAGQTGRGLGRGIFLRREESSSEHTGKAPRRSRWARMLNRYTSAGIVSIRKMSDATAMLRARQTRNVDFLSALCPALDHRVRVAAADPRRRRRLVEERQQPVAEVEDLELEVGSFRRRLGDPSGPRAIRPARTRLGCDGAPSRRTMARRSRLRRLSTSTAEPSPTLSALVPAVDPAPALRALPRHLCFPI